SDLHRVQEPVQLGLGMVEPTGTAPAVGAAVDGAVAVGGAHPVDLGGDERGGPLPGHLHVRVAAPARGTGAVPQPPLAHRGTSDAGTAAQRAAEVVPDRRGGRVLGDRIHGGDLTAVRGDPVGAPVAGGACRSAHPLMTFPPAALPVKAGVPSLSWVASPRAARW